MRKGLFIPNLANDVALQGRFEEAAALNERTLALKEEAPGPEHPSTVNTLNNIGEVYDLTGRDADAEVDTGELDLAAVRGCDVADASRAQRSLRRSPSTAPKPGSLMPEPWMR